MQVSVELMYLLTCSVIMFVEKVYLFCSVISNLTSCLVMKLSVSLVAFVVHVAVQRMIRLACAMCLYVM